MNRLLLSGGIDEEQDTTLMAKLMKEIDQKSSANERR